MNKHLRITLVILTVLLLLSLLMMYMNAKAGRAYANCNEIYRHTGRTNIPKGDPLYIASRDRDHDGIYCDE